MTSSPLYRTSLESPEPTSEAVSEQIDDAAIEAFRSEAALLQLPQTVQKINRTYLRNVSSRSLLTATEAAAWLDQEVTVFLRHDNVKVFAIVLEDQVAMADFLTLIDVKFHVSKIGRLQSNAEKGPLPNFRTVHAFLTGRLCCIADGGALPDKSRWQAVRYNPTAAGHFSVSETQTPITCASAVQMTPGADKVWCPRASEHEQNGLSDASDREATL